MLNFLKQNKYIILVVFSCVFLLSAILSPFVVLIYNSDIISGLTATTYGYTYLFDILLLDFDIALYYFISVFLSLIFTITAIVLYVMQKYKYKNYTKYTKLASLLSIIFAILSIFIGLFTVGQIYDSLSSALGDNFSIVAGNAAISLLVASLLCGYAVFKDFGFHFKEFIKSYKTEVKQNDEIIIKDADNISQ